MVNSPLLLDYVVVFKNRIPKDHCDYIIKSDKHQWSKHSWSQYDTIVDSTDIGKEFDVSHVIDINSKIILGDAIQKSVTEYCYQFQFTVKSWTKPRINKYSQGHCIDPHIDHISSVFDGSKKGIPVISLVGLLNEDFVGGKFYFWQDTEIELNRGDILIFPSSFMFQHRVDKIVSGERWSFVSWAY